MRVLLSPLLTTIRSGSVLIWESNPPEGSTQFAVFAPNYADWHKEASSFDTWLVSVPAGISTTTGGAEAGNEWTRVAAFFAVQVETAPGTHVRGGKMMLSARPRWCAGVMACG